MLHAACRILVPTPGMEPVPPAVEAQSPNHWRPLPSLINSSGVIGNSLATWADLFPSRCSCWYYSSFSHSVVSDSLQTHGLHHARFPCPSPIPGASLNSCPLSPWCHPIISSSVFPFISCLQSFPASGSFPMSQFFTSGGQNIRVSASAFVLPVNAQDWSPLGWTGLNSLQSKGLSRVFSICTVWTFTPALGASQVLLVAENPPASAADARRCRFDHCAGEIPWSRKC